MLINAHMDALIKIPSGTNDRCKEIERLWRNRFVFIQNLTVICSFPSWWSNYRTSEPRYVEKSWRNDVDLDWPQKASSAWGGEYQIPLSVPSSLQLVPFYLVPWEERTGQEWLYVLRWAPPLGLEKDRPKNRPETWISPQPEKMLQVL